MVQLRVDFCTIVDGKCLEPARSPYPTLKLWVKRRFLAIKNGGEQIVEGSHNRYQLTCQIVTRQEVLTPTLRLSTEELLDQSLKPGKPLPDSLCWKLRLRCLALTCAAMTLTIQEGLTIGPSLKRSIPIAYRRTHAQISGRP